MTSSPKPDTLKGGEERDSQASPKPPSRIDNLRWAVLRLANAVELIGQSLDEGPLRTVVLKEASASKTSADKADRPSSRRSDTSTRVQRDHARAMAVQTRHGYQDNPREPLRDEGWPTDDECS